MSEVTRREPVLGGANEVWRILSLMRAVKPVRWGTVVSDVAGRPVGTV
jgi:hypothetical protein